MVRRCWAAACSWAGTRDGSVRAGRELEELGLRLLRPEEEEKRVDRACAWPAEERESREFFFFPFSIFFSYFKTQFKYKSNLNMVFKYTFQSK